MTISGNRCDRRRRQSIRKADVGDPDGNPELQSVRLDVLGGEDGTGVRTTHVPHLKTILFTSGDDLEKKKYVKKECLAAVCDQLTTFSLCGLHYHSLISGKEPVLQLRNGYGEAKYDGTTSRIVYPARTPTDRLPPSNKVKAALANTKQ